MNELKTSELQYDEKTKKLSLNPVVAGASGVATVAMIGSPVFAAAPADPIANLNTAVTGLGTLATAAATVAALPVIIYFGYRIVKRVLAGGT